jgi:hypothetical protein
MKFKFFPTRAILIFLPQFYEFQIIQILIRLILVLVLTILTLNNLKLSLLKLICQLFLCGLMRFDDVDKNGRRPT